MIADNLKTVANHETDSTEGNSTEGNTVSEGLRLRIPRYPRSWYRFGMSKEVKLGAKTPISRSELGREFVAFRAADGAVSVLNGRCSHLGAKLKYAELTEKGLECPLHGWCYSPSGACTHIPTCKNIPDFARQQAYPTVERFGELFYFLDEQPNFEFPNFASSPFESLYPAKPFGLRLEAPWYMVTGNGFDIQHFRQSHDRVLLSEPVVDFPAESSIRVRMRLGVEGDCLRDQIIRRTGGEILDFSYTCWGGTLGFVEARFERASSFGFVSVTPLASDATWYSNTIFVPRRTGVISKHLNFINAELRRMIIFQFLKVDIHRIEGTYSAVERCIEADKALLQYFDWVQRFN